MSDKETIYDESSEYFSHINSAELLMKHAKKFPLLSDEELDLLLEKYRSGDTEARNKIVNSNLRLISKFINRYQFKTKHLQFEDLLQEGTLGILRAIETYDRSKGAFSTYAWAWINHRIRRSIHDKDREIRLPVHLIETTNKINKFRVQYQNENGRMPDNEEIRDALNISKITLENVLASENTNTISIDKQVHEDEEQDLSIFHGEEDTGYEEMIDRNDDRDLLLVMKEVLTRDNYYILYYRVFSEKCKTLDEIGFELGITRERVRQIESVVLKKAKRYMIGSKDKYLQVLNDIHKKEGALFDNLSIYPMEPKDIIIYFYIRDMLSLSERELYKLIYFSKYITDKKQRSKFLNVSEDEYDKIYASLSIKMESLLKNKDKFERYNSLFIKNMGRTMFDLELDSEVNIIDYDYLKEKYGSFTYEEIMAMFGESALEILPNEKKLLKRYFGVPMDSNVAERQIEEEINILIYGYAQKDTSLPKDTLKPTYRKNIDHFSESEQEWLECFYFGTRPREGYVNKYRNNYYYILEKLERLRYGVYRYSENNFSKKEYLEVRKKYRDKLGEDRVRILDLVYGVDTKVHSFDEIGTILNMDYLSVHSQVRCARIAAINLHNGFIREINTNKNIYAPYIESKYYEFTDETRSILHMFVIEEKSYREIAELTGLHTTRISNIVTDGIRRIDFYRVGIIKPFIVQSGELAEFFKGNKSFKAIDKEIIRHKVLGREGNKEIADNLNVPISEVNRIISRFYRLYNSFQIKDVVVDESDIKAELECHISESVLSSHEREVASFYYGIKSEHNKDGLKLFTGELMDKYGHSKAVCYHTLHNIKRALKGRKVGIITPELSYIKRDKLKEILSDPHLPITDYEKTIICHLFELCGCEYKTIEELSSSKENYDVRRAYQRAIVKIFKYMNNEIDGILDYETDIAPILKYFAHTDREFIYDYYKEKFTYESLAKKYNISFNIVVNTLTRIKNSIYDILNNPSSKKFDFDYYLSVVDEPDFPFYGNKSLAKKIMELYHGLNGNKKLDIPEIISVLNLPYKDSAISRVIYNMMVNTCKYRDGIRKSKSFSEEEVLSYYNAHIGEMTSYDKLFYERYFNKRNHKMINYSKERISPKIMLDLIKDAYPDCFRLENATREEVISLLKTYGKRIKKSVKAELLYLFGISERELMNGRDINHVYRVLGMLDRKKEKPHVMVMKNDVSI